MHSQHWLGRLGVGPGLYHETLPWGLRCASEWKNMTTPTDYMEDRVHTSSLKTCIIPLYLPSGAESEEICDYVHHRGRDNQLTSLIPRLEDIWSNGPGPVGHTCQSTSHQHSSRTQILTTAGSILKWSSIPPSLSQSAYFFPSGVIVLRRYS